MCVLCALCPAQTKREADEVAGAVSGHLLCEVCAVLTAGDGGLGAVRQRRGGRSRGQQWQELPHPPQQCIGLSVHCLRACLERAREQLAVWLGSA